MAVWTRGGVTVRWLGGGLLVEHDGSALVVDAPPGVTGAIGDALPGVQAVLLSSGRLQAVGGLVELLVALEPHRRSGVPLSLRVPLGEERGVTIAEAWVRGWPDRYPLTLDAQLPGCVFDIGGLQVSTVPQRSGEPVWRTSEVCDQLAVSVRLQATGATVVWMSAAAPGPGVARACRGADLAVIEVGVLPWPRTEQRWRLSLTDAVEAGGEAGEVWLVGDDGRFLGGEAD